VETVTKAVTFVPGFAAAFSVSGLEGTGMTAAAMWRPTTAAVNPAAIKPAAVKTAAVKTAQHQIVALTQNLKPAALHTQIKHYVVTTPDAGRDNKGTSPWGFPV
jgi:molybdopterin biosynthesis enzyme MoaB